MKCPDCPNELIIDHTTTSGDTTMYFYTCLNRNCPSFRKILNGSEEGKEAEVIEPVR